MNYLEVYKNLINKGLSRSYGSKRYSCLRKKFIPEQYTEVHHIIPKSIGGTNKLDNLVVLTAREHYIAHKLLTKIYSENDKITQAFIIMHNRTKMKTSRFYEVCKLKSSKFISKVQRERFRCPLERTRLSEKLTETYKSTKLRAKISERVKASYTQEMRDNSSKMSKARYTNPEYMCKFKKSLAFTKTEEFRLKMSEITKEGNKNNPELRQKRSTAIAAHQKYKSEDWKRKCAVWSSGYMNRPEIKEMYRNKIKGRLNPMARKVYNIELDLVYFTAVDAAEHLNINLSTLKKYLYRNNKKFNCVWYDNYTNGGK